MVMSDNPRPAHSGSAYSLHVFNTLLRYIISERLVLLETSFVTLRCEYSSLPRLLIGTLSG